MARVRRRRLRRIGLVFLGSLVAHIWVVWLAAATLLHPYAVLRAYAAPAIPVEVVPPLNPPPPPRPRPLARRPPRPKPLSRIAPPPALLAEAPEIIPAAPLATPGEVAASTPPPASGAPAAEPGASAIPTLEAPPQTYPINPGYWEVIEHWPLISRTERYCVEPENITRFMAAPCNHIYHCAYPVQTIENGRFSFEGVIWKKDERYSVRGGGDYSPTSMRLSLHGHGHWRILPFVFSASLDGQYLGAECPADAKRIRQR